MNAISGKDAPVSRPATGVALKNLRAITAEFTDNQWYCHLARQTVFFCAYSVEALDLDGAKKLAANITRLAPHLLGGFIRTDAKAALSGDILSQIVSVQETDNLDQFPNLWSMNGDEIFDNNTLPLFRVRVATLKEGTNKQGTDKKGRDEKGRDEKGRRSVILVLACHSLLEGTDATNLSRSQTVERGAVTAKPKSISGLRKFGYRAMTAVLAPLQLVAANLFANRKADISHKSLVIERKQLRAAANNMGVNQQALMFSLATFAINNGGEGFSKKAISTLYADLSKSADFQTNDDFFSFRMIDLKLPVHTDFKTFVRSVDDEIKKAEGGNKSATQILLNSMYGAHRWIHSIFPFLYTAQLFRFTAGYNMTLSLVPPQRLAGALTRGMVEPVYNGTFHPGINSCVFTPGREYVTFSFSLRAKHLDTLEKIPELLQSLQ